MNKVHMHAGAIGTTKYDHANVREIIHSLKLVDDLSIHTHNLYNNLHLCESFNGHATCTCILIFFSNASSELLDEPVHRLYYSYTHGSCQSLGLWSHL